MKRAQRGMALIMVLMMVAAMAALATITQQYWLQNFSRTRSLHYRMEDKWALLGAESVTQYHYSPALLAPVLRPGSIGKMSYLKLDERIFDITVRDLQACFNLNALFSEETQKANAEQNKNDKANVENEKEADSAKNAEQPHNKYAEDLFTRLLTGSGINEDQAKEVVRYLKEKSEKSGRLFEDISELRQAWPFTLRQWRVISAVVCVLPDTRMEISVNGLNQEHLLLISALLNGSADKKEIMNWLAARPDKGWKSLNSLAQGELSEESLSALNKVKAYLVIKSDYFLLTMQQHDAQSWPLRSWLKKSGSDFMVIKRQYGISE